MFAVGFHPTSDSIAEQEFRTEVFVLDLRYPPEVYEPHSFHCRTDAHYVEMEEAIQIFQRENAPRETLNKVSETCQGHSAGYANLNWVTWAPVAVMV